MDFADDPALDEGDILGGGNFDGDFVIVEPGVGVATTTEISTGNGVGRLRLTGLRT